MTASESTKSSELPDDAASVKMSVDARIAHFAAGYSNSQSIVQFLDAKAAAVIGAVPVLLAILAAVLTSLLESSNWPLLLHQVGWKLPAIAVIAMLILALSILATAWWAVRAAFDAISPRGPAESRSSILFPFSHDPGAERATEFEARIQLFMTNATQQDAIEDWSRQARRMGQILNAKFKDVKRAIYWLGWVFALSAVALLVLLAVAAVGAVTKSAQHFNEKISVNHESRGSTDSTLPPTTRPR